MKNMYKFLVALVLFMSVTVMNAQNADNRWSFAVGVNAIDLYPVGEEDQGLGGYFDEFANVDHYNLLAVPSRFEIGYYVGDGIVATGAASVNRIDRRGDTRIENLSYFSLDGGLRYNLNELWNESSILNPYLGVGGSYQWLEDDGFGTFNGTFGFDVNITENLLFNVQTTYKHALEDAFPKHFQHTAGVKFIWGATDTDGDGITDRNDSCPDVAGLEEFMGCPDRDGDGIEDAKDDCPNNAGPMETNGCPDTDGDSVLDKDDKCPDEAGEVALMGCPDADADGVADGDDKCPNAAGLAKFMGCPDTDGDGIQDSEDDCPKVAGVAENKGCPIVKPTEEVVKALNTYARNILFDTGKASFQKSADEVLQAMTVIFKEYPSANFSIEGYTDSVGSDSNNQLLSEERANAVRNYLISNGIGADRLAAAGFGETKPIATNNTRAGREENRRVEINLVK
jgi:outer membrane protein OmpA-like peptidoglycan-associated protein